MRRKLLCGMVLMAFLACGLVAGCGRDVTAPQDPSLNPAGLEGGDGDKLSPSGLEGGDGDKITP